MAAWPNPLDEPLDVLDQPFTCEDLAPPGFASLLQLDACLLETSRAKEPAAAAATATQPTSRPRCRRPMHLRLAQLRLSTLESILIVDTNADLDRFGDGVLPKRRRSSTTASYDLSRDTSSDASFGVGSSG